MPLAAIGIGSDWVSVSRPVQRLSARRPQVALLHRLVAAEVAADPMLSVAAHTPDALTLEYSRTLALTATGSGQLACSALHVATVPQCLRADTGTTGPPTSRPSKSLRRCRPTAPCRESTQRVEHAQNTRRTRALCRALVGVCRMRALSAIHTEA